MIPLDLVRHELLSPHPAELVPNVLMYIISDSGLPTSSDLQWHSLARSGCSCGLVSTEQTAILMISDHTERVSLS